MRGMNLSLADFVFLQLVFRNCIQLESLITRVCHDKSANAIKHVGDELSLTYSGRVVLGADCIQQAWSEN